MLWYPRKLNKRKKGLGIIWTGPYELWRLYDNGSAKLRDLEGRELPERVNRSKLKKYHTRDSDDFWSRADKRDQGQPSQEETEGSPNQENDQNDQEPQLQWMFTQEEKAATEEETEVGRAGKEAALKRNWPRVRRRAEGTSLFKIWVIITIITAIGFLALSSRAEAYKHLKPQRGMLSNNLCVRRASSSCLSSAFPLLPIHSLFTVENTANGRVYMEDFNITHERIAPRDLEEADKARFRKAGLLQLYKIMQKMVDMEIAAEAVQNYDSDKKLTTIKKVKVAVNHENLSKYLGLANEDKGEAWDNKQIATYLKETPEMTQKRKKLAQGVPVQSFAENTLWLNFVAQAICLKKDKSYLGESVMKDATRILNGGQADWAKILEKALDTQTRGLKEGKQKMYSCAPIWQQLYEKTRQEQKAKRTITEHEPEATKEGKRRKLNKLGRAKSGGSLKTVKEENKSSESLKRVEAQKIGEVRSESMHDFIDLLINPGDKDETGKGTQEPCPIKLSQEEGRAEGKSAPLTQQSPDLQHIWEEWYGQNPGTPHTLKSLMLKEPVLPFQKIQALDIKGETDNPGRKKEARVRTLMIAMNTMALQSQKLMEEAAEDSQAQERAAQEIEQIKDNEKRNPDKIGKATAGGSSCEEGAARGKNPERTRNRQT